MKLFKGIGNGILGIANTALSIIKDKQRDPDTSFIEEKVRKGVSISNKRVLNLGGTTSLISFGIWWLQGGKEPAWIGLALIGLGVVYCVGMAWITKESEKDKSE